MCLMTMNPMWIILSPPIANMKQRYVRFLITWSFWSYEIWPQMTSYFGHMTFELVLKRLFRCDQTVDRILNWPQFNFKKAISMCRFWPILDTLDHIWTIFWITRETHNQVHDRWWIKTVQKTGFNRFKPVWTEKTTLLPLTDNLTDNLKWLL